MNTNILHIFANRCTQNSKFFLRWCPPERLIFFDIVSKMPRKEPGPLLIFLLIASNKTFTILVPNTAEGPLAV